MNFPGSNELTLSDEAIHQAIEGALNSSRKDGEDYIHVTEITRSYSYGPWKLTLTTDAPEVKVADLKAVA